MYSKLDWKKRYRRKELYAERYLHEVYMGIYKFLDIGTGPGEFLSLCERYGNSAIGIENTPHDDLPSYVEYRKYLRECRKIHRENKFKVIYKDLYSDFSIKSQKNFDVVNCEATINYILKDVFVFGPANDGIWIESDKTKSRFITFFVEVKKVLKPGGVLLLSALRSQNLRYYSDLVMSVAEESGLSLIKDFDHIRHKWIYNEKR